MNFVIKNWFKLVVVSLLMLNLVVATIGLSKNNSNAESIEDNIKYTVEATEYRKNIGKKHLQIIDDKVSTSTYGSKSIVGTMVNNSNELIESISGHITFYKDNDIIGYGSAYLQEIAPKGKLQFSVYVDDECENFDRYTIDYIEAMIYK